MSRDSFGAELPAELVSIADANKLDLLERRMNPSLGSAMSAQSRPSSGSSVGSGSKTGTIIRKLVKTGSNSLDAVLDRPGKSSSNNKKAKRTSKRKFTVAEDKVLHEAARQGKDWGSVSSLVKGHPSLSKRPEDQVRSRFLRLRKKRKSLSGSSSSASASAAVAVAATTTTTASSTVSASSPPSIVVVDLMDTSPDPTPTAGGASASSTPPAVDVQMAEIAQAREELSHRENRLEATLSQRERELQARMQEQMEQWKAQYLQQQQSKDERTRKALMQCLKAEAASMAEAARRRLASDCVSFGNTAWVRRGATSLEEVWKDGSAVRDLDVRQATLGQRKTDIQAKQKEIRALKKDGDQDASLLTEKEELYKLQLKRLARDEKDLVAERDKLDTKISLHQRELKRQRDEDNSRFELGHVLCDGRYLLLQLLGKGGFSEVFKAYDLVDMQYVACKIHQLHPHWPEAKKQNYVKHAIREYQIHEKLVHERIVRQLNVFEIDDDSFCTVLEYCDGSDLDFVLKNRKQLPEREAKSILLQVLRALEYLNKLDKPVIHYDLKPANILYMDGEVKLTDFGLSKVMEHSEASSMELTSQGAGTYWYLPPECFDTSVKPRISSKVDVWSVGVIMYQMLYAEKPFGHNMSQQSILADNIISLRAKVNFPEKPNVSAECKQFIRSCLTSNQADRPEILELMHSPYVMSPTVSRRSSSSTGGASRSASSPRSTLSSSNTGGGPTVFRIPK